MDDAEKILWTNVSTALTNLDKSVSEKFGKVFERLDATDQRIGHLETTLAVHQKDHNGGNGGFHMPSLSRNQVYVIVAAVAFKILVGVNIFQYMANGSGP